ncbi:membrane protein insertase YidC [Xenophilus sp. Marseille-Q4582]|uniref:membrane protein insertase YidC n=1 Tax=Xenophilus sp. Marseille-Q4582 TaxID=2866600 RepID=UPI001CE48784|nr:membrane protein insertase YidC [Xenophilus sp. Marseille-Q4582]
MNDIRRTILWVIFGFSLVMLWDQWQVHNGRQPTFLPSAKPPAAAPADPAAAGGAAGASGVPSAAAGSAAPAGTPPTAAATAAAAATSEKVQVQTDVYNAVLDGQGGTLSRLELSQYIEEKERTGLMPWFRRITGQAEVPVRDHPVLLMDDASPATRYLAQTGLLNPVAGGGAFPTHLSLMAVKPGPYKLAEGQNQLDVVFESQPAGGIKYVKTYQFRRGDYVIRVKHDVVNVSDQPREPQLYMQLTRHGADQGGSMFGTSTFSGPAVYTNEKKFHKVSFADISKNKAELPPAAQDGWIAMVQHYFASAWLLNLPGSDNLKREFRVSDLGSNQYAISMVASLPSLAPGATQTVESSLFAGPADEKKLEVLAPGLELIKDYGIFAIISKPLYWLLDKLHSLLGNWGWAIVALVVLLKAAFYWLNAKAYASMAKMKKINPRIMEMRERLKDKPQEMQQEMMRIYRDEKVNPLGGCFPIVIQIPVFIALYWVLLSSVEMRHAPWILWIRDLSAPDPWFILPLVMTGTTLLQTWLNPTPPDPLQARLMWIMPLAFSVMFFIFPAGLVLYWITNNILSIAQQWFINKRLGVLGK